MLLVVVVSRLIGRLRDAFLSDSFCFLLLLYCTSSSIPDLHFLVFYDLLMAGEFPFLWYGGREKRKEKKRKEKKPHITFALQVPLLKYILISTPTSLIPTFFSSISSGISTSSFSSILLHGYQTHPKALSAHLALPRPIFQSEEPSISFPRRIKCNPPEIIHPSGLAE